MSGEPAPSEAAVGERRGPLVHRAVHHGAYLLILGAVEFVVAMAVTQWGWNSSAPYGSYSLLHNYISDLGAVNCGAWPSGSTHYVCSPWHLVFNAGIVALGLLLLLGVILIRTGFPARRSSSLGLGFLAIAAVGAIGVGLSPEDVNYYVHAGSAVVAFLFGNLALILLGVAMFRDTRWDGYRAYTMFSGLVGLVALFLYLGHAWGPLGVGGMERLIVAPLLLWAVVAGVHLARVPTYAPTRIHGTST